MRWFRRTGWLRRSKAAASKRSGMDLHRVRQGGRDVVPVQSHGTDARDAASGVIRIGRSDDGPSAVVGRRGCSVGIVGRLDRRARYNGDIG